jgi:hypothetical protein
MEAGESESRIDAIERRQRINVAVYSTATPSPFPTLTRNASLSRDFGYQATEPSKEFLDPAISPQILSVFSAFHSESFSLALALSETRVR